MATLAAEVGDRLELDAASGPVTIAQTSFEARDRAPVSSA